jgi:hypothetical protein
LGLLLFDSLRDLTVRFRGVGVQGCSFVYDFFSRQSSFTWVSLV